MIRDSNPKALAIIYTFPGDAVQTEYGIDVHSQDILPKGFVIHGISQTRVGEAFMNCLKDKYAKETMPVVVLNDTPAVLFSEEGAKIGIVDGSGFNMAITIDGIVYNMETGNYSGIPAHTIARMVDENDKITRGRQLAEKQISGIYLEQQINLVLDNLINKNLVQGSTGGHFKSDFISYVLGKSKQDFERKMKLSLDTYSYAIITALAGRLRKRSARAVGMMIGTVLNSYPKDFSTGMHVKIPVEGSVFWGIPTYKELVLEVVNAMTKGKYKIEFIEKEHAGILGAGAVALDVAAQLN